MKEQTSTQIISAELLALAETRDRRGHLFHVAFAALFALTVPLGPAANAVAFGILGFYAILRLWATAPCHLGLLRSRFAVSCAALFFWQFTALLWSPDQAQGLSDLASHRYIVPLMLAVWPVMRSVDYLICATAAAAVTTMIAQLLQCLYGDSFPLSLWWHGERIADRFPGFHHPNSTAVFHMTVFLLCLAAVLSHCCSQRCRIAAGLTAICSAGGLLMTGSRGPWLAASVGIMILISSVLLDRMSRVKRFSLSGSTVATVCMLVVIAVIVFAFRHQVTYRIQAAINDVREVAATGALDSDTGIRLAQAELAWELGEQNPWLGVGTGGYLASIRRKADESGARIPIHPHPHNAFLYALACTGWPGLLIMIWVWLEAARLAWRASVISGSDACQTLRSGIATGLPAATGALFIAFQLDCHNLSGSGSTMFAALAFLAFTVLIHPVAPCAGSDRTLAVPTKAAP